MPEFNESDRAFIVQQMGKDPSQYDYDEASNTVRRKVNRVSPSASPDSIQTGSDTLTSKQVGPNKEVLGSAATALGTLAEDAIPSAVGGLGMLGGAGAVGTIGTALGIGSGPLGWLALAGGVGAGYLASKLTKEEIVDPAIQGLMPGALETLREGQAANPWSARLGGLGGMALGGMKPSMTALGAVPKALQGMSLTAKEMMAAKNALASGGIGAGINVAESAAQGQPFDLGSTIESGLMGSIMSSPNAIGRKMGFHDPALVKSEPNAADLAQPAVNPDLAGIKPSVEIFQPNGLSTQDFWNHLAAQREANSQQTDLPYKYTKAMDERAKAPIANALSSVRIPNAGEGMLGPNIEPKQLEMLKRLADFQKARQEASLQNADEVLTGSIPNPELSNFANRVGEKPAQAIERTVARPEELPTDVESDNTLRQQQANAEVAAENDLVERQWEGKGDKYSSDSSLNDKEIARTKAEQDTQDAAKFQDLPTESTPFWKSFFNTLGKKRGVKLTDDGTIVDSNGKPVAGQIGERQGGNELEGKINPNKEGPDTRPHELFHPFINDLLKSNRGRDRAVASKYLKAIEQLPEYQSWAKQRAIEGNQFTPEEFAATNNGVEAYNRALNIKGESPIKKWWKDNTSYFKTRFTDYATPDEMQRVLYYKMLHDPSFSSIIPKNLRVNPTSSSVIKNATQQTFDNLDKDASDNSKFAIMRKAVDDPAFAERYMREMEAKYMKQDLADGHNNTNPNAGNKYSSESLFTPEELASGEIKLNNQPKPLEEQKPITIVPQEQKLPITHTAVTDTISDLIKKNADMSMPVEKADKLHKYLLDNVDMSKAPEMEQALRSPDFDTADPDHWQVINKLHNVALDRVDNEKLSPKSKSVQVPRTIPDNALESGKEIPVTTTESQKPKREKVSRNTEENALKPGIDYIPGEVQKNSVPSGAKQMEEVKPIDTLKQEPKDRQAEYKRNVELWDEVEKTTKPYDTLKKIESRIIEEGRKLDTISKKDSPEGKHVKNNINNLYMQRSVLADKFKIPVKSLADTFSESGIRSRYSSSSLFNKQTETPEFKKWFGNGFITDNNGKPLRVYHGTAGTDDFTSFKVDRPHNPSRAKYLGGDDNEHAGIYFTPRPDYSESYMGSLQKHSDGDVRFTYDEGARSIPVYLNIQNPKEMFWGYGFLSKEQIASLKADGYDGVVAYKDQFGPRGESLTLPEKMAQKTKKDIVEIVAFDPTQIKSAIGNSGTFDPSNPDIRYSTSSLFWRPEIEKIRSLDHKNANIAADSLNEFYRSKTRFNGKLVNQVTVPLIKTLDYTKPREIMFQDSDKLRNTLQYMYDMQDKGRSNIRPDANILKLIKDNLAISLAEKNRVLSGKQKQDPNYIPNMVSRNVLDKWLNAPHSQEAMQYVKDWYDYYNANGKTNKEAKEALNTLKAGYTKQKTDIASQFGPIDDSAGIGIPRSWREKNLIDLMARFNDRYARRLAYIEAIEQNPKAMEALFNPEDGLQAAKEVKNVLDDIQGVREIEEMGRTAVMGVVKAAWMGTLTGAKDFASNLTLGFQHQTIPQALISPFKAWGSIKEHIAETYKTGINRQNIGSIEFDDSGISNAAQVLRRTRDVLNTVSGRNILERVTRATAFGQGKWVAIDNIQRAHKGSLTSQTKKFLDDFVPDWQKYAKTGILPTEVAQEAGARYSESVQGTYDYRGLPNISQRGSLAPFLALSRWNIEKLNNFEKHVVKPALKGNYTPLLMSTLGMFLGGEAVNQIVQNVTGRKEKTPKLEEIKEIAESGNSVVMPITYKLAALASLSGFAGIAGDLTKMGMDKYYHNKAQPFNSPMLEIIGQASQTAGDIVDALKNGDVDITADVINQILEDTFQVYRIAQAQLDPKKKTELEKANKLRDLKLWRNTHGYDSANVTSDRPNPFLNKDIKEFKEEPDVNKAVAELPSLIEKAGIKAKGNPDILSSELAKLKGSKYGTMPSPEETPYSFAKYYEYLVKTKGEDEARKIVEDYAKQNAVDRAKNSMIPTIPK